VGVEAFGTAIGESSPLPLGSNNVGRIVEFPPATPIVEFPAGVPVGANIGGVVVGSDGIGAASAIVGAGFAAIGGALSAPVSAPVIGGSIIGAAIIGGLVGYFTQPKPGTSPATYVGKPKFTGDNLGTPGKVYKVFYLEEIGGQNCPSGEGNENFTLQLAPFGVFKFPGKFGTCEGKDIIQPVVIGGSPFDPTGSGNVVVAKVLRIEPPDDTAEQVPVVNGGISVAPSPERAFNEGMRRGLPGFPGGDTIPTRPPVPTPVKPGNKPNSPPAPGLRAPTTGRTAAPTPEGGAWTIDPIIPREDTPSNPVPKEKNRQREADTVVITGGNCPSPCPEVDLSPVLEAIQAVKTELDDVNEDTNNLIERVGFASPPVQLTCGVPVPIPTVEEYLTLLDGKVGIDQAIKIGKKPDGSDMTYCTVGEALEAIGKPDTTIIIAPDSPQRKPNRKVLVAWFNLDPKIIKQRVRLQIPDAKDVDTATLKNALTDRIYGGWRVSLRFPTGENISGYFQNPDTGMAYLENVISICSNLVLDSEVARIKTFDAQKASSISSGTTIYSVRGFLSDGSSIQNSYILTS
jgi:hypothetical protein